MRIVLMGKAGAGKDEVADYLVKNYKFNRYAFADKLKEIAAELFPEQYQNNRRQMLQDLGIKMREVETDCWVKYILRKVEEDTIFDSVITDCRFKNEYDLCLQAGFIPVLVTCPDKIRSERLFRRDGRRMTPVEMAHISEQLQAPAYYRIENAGTREELYQKIDQLVREQNRLGFRPINHL